MRRPGTSIRRAATTLALAGFAGVGALAAASPAYAVVPADSVTTVTVTPPTATLQQPCCEASYQSITVTLTDSVGHPVAGVLPNVAISGATPNQPLTWSATATGADGSITGYYPGLVGTDTVLVWVNRSGGTPSYDAGEPNATVTRTLLANVGISAHCVQQDATAPDFGQSVQLCNVPTTAKTVTVVGTAERLGVPEPNWFVPIGGPGPGGCTTDSSGSCTITVPTGTPKAGDKMTFVVQPDKSITPVIFTFVAAVAQAATVTPTTQTLPAHATATVVATVRDQFGAPVAGHVVSITVGGRNTLAARTLVTGADGTVHFSYADTGPTATGGTDSIVVDGVVAAHVTFTAVVPTPLPGHGHHHGYGHHHGHHHGWPAKGRADSHPAPIATPRHGGHRD